MNHTLQQWLASANFRKHNRGLWGPTGGEGGYVLVELNQMASSHIAYSYLGRTLTRHFGAKLGAFIASEWKSRALPSFLLKTLRQLRWWFFQPEARTYRSFGCDRLVYPYVTLKRKREAQELVEEHFAENATKRGLEEFSVRGVVIGDLVYDTFLRSNAKPTLDLENPRFQRFLISSVAETLFWIDEIESGRVKAVVVSHCVYNLAIPLRAALSRGVWGFQATATAIYRLSKDRPFAYDEFREFPQAFSELPKKTQQSGLLEARERLSRRFLGEVGVDMAYSSKSAYGPVASKDLLRNTGKPQVLVATHCFFDSPHSYGVNLFPDFWEWLHFLGKISTATNYDWYLKTHPDFLPGNLEILGEFVREYPLFSLLPPEASHHQLIAEGIDVALTVYGTIGFEYPYLGVPVINASQNNPHIAYSFDFHPISIEKYEELILSIPAIRRPNSMDRELVEEFYFMKNLFQTGDLFFDDFQKTVSGLGGYQHQFTAQIYEEFLIQLSPQKHELLLEKIDDFIHSGDFLLTGTRSIEV